MAINISLVSEQNNVINNFLSSFFDNKITADADTYEWDYYLHNDLDSINLISCLMDNIELYPSLNLWVSFDPNLFIKVKEDNYENLIKYIANRYSI
jgi:hypothetical protein